MYRRANAGDFDAVYALICELEEQALDRDKIGEIYAQQLQDRRYCCLLCELDGEIVGMLNLRFEEQLHHAGTVAEILEFAVSYHHRSRGIGRELFAEACQIARDKGCMLIEAASNQRRLDAHRFYQREGMQSRSIKFSMSL
ncbi:MAG: GNAT family N-acetyltransferase [Clostridia bacterium]|nr:GNAT family N-acetyltransferase [Clostridia bacterium]